MNPRNDDAIRHEDLLLVVGAAGLAFFVACILVQFSPLADYFIYIAEYASDHLDVRLVFQFLFGTYLYFLFSALSYSFINPTAKAFATKSSRLSKLVDRAARAVILLCPTLVLAWSFVDAARSVPGSALMIWVAASILVLSAILQLVLAFAKPDYLTSPAEN